MAAYTNEELDKRINEEFPDWFYSSEQDQLVSVFEFPDFNEAVNFVNVVANIAEEQGHHPDVFIYDYKYVQVLTSTHDENGITDKDFQLIQGIEDMLNELTQDQEGQQPGEENTQTENTEEQPQ